MGTQESSSSGDEPAESGVAGAGESGNLPGDGPWLGGQPAGPLHARNMPDDEPAARFETQERPQRYARGIGQRQPTRPPDPIHTYMPPPVARRRRSDWAVLIFALVVASIVMVGCCVAGFGLYSGYGAPFH